MVPVRLDVVVKVKAREEDKRLEAMAQAVRQVEVARAALRDAQAQADRDLSGCGVAADFCVYEAARARALEAVKRARLAVGAAVKAVESTRAAWVTARSQTDAVRRVADTRRAEVQQLADRQERRASDDLTLMRFARTG
ncbi:MAG: flagellar FliJ family protein [Myxococcales bacterium]|nr:flagellar FliJ family protein [Myxococcales bacterium]